MFPPFLLKNMYLIIIHQLFLLKVGVITDVTREGDRNKVSSWGSGREFIGRFIVNINLGATQAETKAVIFHSSSLFMDPPSTPPSKNRKSYYIVTTPEKQMTFIQP